jgi:hypothetical protein
MTRSLGPYGYKGGETLARNLRALGGRPHRKDLANFVDSLPKPTKMLGLTHVTSSYALRDIIDLEEIKAVSKCKVLEEEVIYAFYGRTAYRYKDEMVPANISSLFPSVLILDPERVPKPKYVFGFDSGAFYDGAMDQHLHPYMPLFDFLLSPDPSSAARLVAAVFDNNEDYFQNRSNPNFQVPNGNFEAESYHSLVKSGGQGNIRLDDRLSTPEFVFSDPIALKIAVRAAILPDTLAAEPNIGGRLRGLGIRVDAYPWTTCGRPGENHFYIQSLAKSIYVDLGWI